MINMKRFQLVFKPRSLLAGLLCLWLPGINAQSFGLGDIPLDPETYESYLQTWPDQFTEALPSSYDARNDGIVTSPKNQGNCGSCWAFASVGAFESHLLKQFGGSPSDLSEQQLNSCDTSMSGCCGGSSTAIRFWETKGPIQESCGPYGEAGTSCPTQRTVPCSNMNGCSQLSQRVTGFYTVPNDPSQMKTSLYNDGPSYWRFTVYSDFNNFWNTAAPGTVYRNSGGSVEGGHAVLLIGWDDAKQAYLCKNSWGATGGPQHDGTFWIAYSGHTNDLGFGMANFKLTGGGVVSPSLIYLYYASNYQAVANYYAKLGLVYNSTTYRYYAWAYQYNAMVYLYYAYTNAPSGTQTATYAYYAYLYAYYANNYAYYTYLGYHYETYVGVYAYYSRYYAAMSQYHAAFND